ncbi:hypothetical protein AWB80_02180 [Caballeronia pedi]|uniref:Uncharacterized protein n=1 Tax=Caballeronia pedi TaxID=1777141 RepID=A0A158AG15_9BURK|nr:hypothetical protein AWB80_02180 [Caballeronia pedi]
MRAASKSAIASDATPASTSAWPIADPAPPAPISSARLPFGSQPASRNAATMPMPSDAPPCHVPSALRLSMLTAPRNAPSSVSDLQCAVALNLCGTVMITPSQFCKRAMPAKNVSRSSGATCAGITIASRLAARSAAVTPEGERTCAIGSPTMKYTRVAPLKPASSDAEKEVSCAMLRLPP